MRNSKTRHMANTKMVNRKSASRLLAPFGFCFLIAACAAASANPREPAYQVRVGFPDPGTKWIYRSVNQAGAVTTMTFVALGEGTHEGKPVYGITNGLDTLVYDQASANLVATFRMGKEVFAASPHDETFSSPIWVGKSWTTNFTAHDRIRGFSHSPVQVNWKVESFEDVTVPAGTFKAFRLQSSVPVGNAFSILWYAPEINLIVKRIDERTSRHPLGSDKRTTETTEIIEYHKPTKTAQRSSGDGVWH